MHQKYIIWIFKSQTCHINIKINCNFRFITNKKKKYFLIYNVPQTIYQHAKIPVLILDSERSDKCIDFLFSAKKNNILMQIYIKYIYVIL